MRYLLFLLLPLFLLGSQSLPDFTYPNAIAKSQPKQEPYNKLEFWVKGKGYIKIYGTTYLQDFQHPKNIGADYKNLTESFFIKKLNIPDLAFKDGIAHFTKEGKNYYIKLSTYANSYSYIYLHEMPCPDLMTLQVDGKYNLAKSKKLTFAPHILLPDVKGFEISRAKYFDYDEFTFYYAKKGHLHKGEFWDIEYSKIAKDSYNYRYMLAHDYKKKLLALGGEILDDEDNSFVFKLGDTIGKFASYNSAFSIKMIQEESFKQALILTPDAIKTELDKTGKITLDGIYFDFNKATLKAESQKAILSTVALMQRYNDLVLSIHGHTDNKGSETYNAKLSSERAAAVMNAIIAQGIDASRLDSKGHGERDPIATNDTEDGRAKNRRVELHKESGGDKKSVITIDFIKPIENSVASEAITYQKSSLGMQYSKPYSQEKVYKEYKGTQKKISYEIIKDNKRDMSFSRKAIIKNYENVLELYNAKIIGEYSDTLYFEIADRGDGKQVFGRIEGYTGSYTIRFLIKE